MTVERFVRQKWWKILSLLILGYAFSFGFLVPLKPGLITIDTSLVKTGENVSIEVTGYNTHFDRQPDQIAAWIKLDSIHVSRIQTVSVKDRKKLTLSTLLPSYLPGDKDISSATLIIGDPVDGYIITPTAFSIAKVSGVSNEIRWEDRIPIRDYEWSFQFPFRSILYETIRNTFFHIAIWMALFVLLVVSLVSSIRYMRYPNLKSDAIASSFAYVAMIFGVIGLITGSIWAKNTWGAFWTNDPKLNMAAISMMIYWAYGILRSSIKDDDSRARVSAAYNVFAFVAMIPLIFIIPRLTSSLHPGNGGNPALGGEDMDNTLRMVFYPAVIGLTLLGTWISVILYRMRSVELKRIHNELYQK